MIENFKIVLRKIYVKKYKYKEIYHFGNRFIQYVKKFDFTNKYVENLDSISPSIYLIHIKYY